MINNLSTSEEVEIWHRYRDQLRYPDFNDRMQLSSENVSGIANPY